MRGTIYDAGNGTPMAGEYVRVNPDRLLLVESVSSPRPGEWRGRSCVQATLRDVYWEVEPCHRHDLYRVELETDDEW